MIHEQEFLELIVACQWTEFLIVYFLVVTGALHPERGFIAITRHYRRLSLDIKLRLFQYEMKLRRLLAEWRERGSMRYHSGGYRAIQRREVGLPSCIKHPRTV
jgi:hypothetical protein